MEWRFSKVAQWLILVIRIRNIIGTVTAHATFLYSKSGALNMLYLLALLLFEILLSSSLLLLLLLLSPSPVVVCTLARKVSSCQVIVPFCTWQQWLLLFYLMIWFSIFHPDDRVIIRGPADLFIVIYILRSGYGYCSWRWGYRHST